MKCKCGNDWRKMKAKKGDKIKLTKNICYGSAFSLIEADVGSIYTVNNRNNSDDGVETVETIPLADNVFNEKKIKLEVWDEQYEIIN